MDKIRTKILMLVEGAKTDVKLMNQLLSIYGLNEGYELVSYNTNIYTLYKQMFSEHDPASYDLLQVLKAREKDAEKKQIFDQAFSDIILVFDLDPHDPDFSPEKIQEMVDYFNESSDMGKLYLNYPMVESFYHMKSIPDPDYDTYMVTMDELLNHKYKNLVGQITHDQRKFAATKEKCTTVILQNIEKSKRMTISVDSETLYPPEQADILTIQLKSLTESSLVHVLCTCPFYIVDYNPNLLSHEFHFR